MADSFFKTAADAIKSWLGITPGAEATYTHDHEVRQGEYNGLLARFTRLSQRLRITQPPRLLVRENDEPNASYSPGKNTVSITTGSLARFSESEQDSELAHELGHVKDLAAHRGYRPSREREFRADAWAVIATGDPQARISGLRKIEQAAENDHAAMQGSIENRMGPHAARLYGSLPEFAQSLIQESAFHGKRLLRRLRLDKHPLEEERYQRLEAMRELMPGPDRER